MISFGILFFLLFFHFFGNFRGVLNQFTIAVGKERTDPRKQRTDDEDQNAYCKICTRARCIYTHARHNHYH